MNHIAERDFILLVVVLVLVFIFIGTMIITGIKIAADSKVEDAEKSVQRRAERRAREIVKERLDGCTIEVIQKIDIVEDDLKGERA